MEEALGLEAASLEIAMAAFEDALVECCDNAHGCDRRTRLHMII